MIQNIQDTISKVKDIVQFRLNKLLSEDPRKNMFYIQIQAKWKKDWKKFIRERKEYKKYNLAEE